MKIFVRQEYEFDKNFTLTNLAKVFRFTFAKWILPSPLAKCEGLCASLPFTSRWYAKRLNRVLFNAKKLTYRCIRDKPHILCNIWWYNRHQYWALHTFIRATDIHNTTALIRRLAYYLLRTSPEHCRYGHRRYHVVTNDTHQIITKITVC